MRRAPEALPEEVVGLLAPFFPGFDLARIRILEGIPFYVLGNPIGYADRNRIYFEPGACRLDTIDGLSLLAHEIAHCRQYQVLGTWRFRLRYLRFYFANRRRGLSRSEAYLNIPFEIEAREVEARVHLALRRLQQELWELDRSKAMSL
ncbi:MAG: DUF4157 domain-containing protein [Blastocatellia bacterium]|nr:DUF4157 domain-containing protein [Blastocatellia bacterium]